MNLSSLLLIGVFPVFLFSGCNLHAHKEKITKIDNEFCEKIVEQKSSRIKVINDKQKSLYAGNYFKKSTALEELGFNEKEGNILFLNCIKLKYREVINEEIEPLIEEYGKDVNYPKDTTFQACDSEFKMSIVHSNNRGAKPYYLMSAICRKFKINEGIKEIDKMIVRGGDLMQQGCSIYDLYRSDQPGRNLQCVSRINNLAEKGFPASGALAKWRPDAHAKAKNEQRPK